MSAGTGTRKEGYGTSGMSGMNDTTTITIPTVTATTTTTKQTILPLPTITVPHHTYTSHPLSSPLSTCSTPTPTPRRSIVFAQEKVKEGTLFCAGCHTVMNPKAHLQRVYGEWEKKWDYYRSIGVDHYDKMKTPAFNLSDHVHHTRGCALAFAYDIQQPILAKTIPHYYHALFHHRYRNQDLPIQRKPSPEVIEGFRSSGVGLTYHQLDLLETKYPFLTCELRQGHEFVEHWPNEQYAFYTGNNAVLESMHLLQLPIPILKRLVLRKERGEKAKPVLSLDEHRELQIRVRKEYWSYLGDHKLPVENVNMDLRWMFQLTISQYEEWMLPVSWMTDHMDWYPITIQNMSPTTSTTTSSVTSSEAATATTTTTTPNDGTVDGIVNGTVNGTINGTVNAKAPPSDFVICVYYVNVNLKSQHYQSIFKLTLKNQQDQPDQPHDWRPVTSPDERKKLEDEADRKKEMMISSWAQMLQIPPLSGVYETEQNLDMFINLAGNPDADDVVETDLSLPHPDLDSDNDNDQ